jgi:glutamine synthetase
VKGDATRVELRSPDPSCNPYLTFAIILAAGLDGIKRNLRPNAPVEKNIYLMTEEDRKSAGIECLPENLYQALKALESDRVITEALGNHAQSKFIKAKLEEWDEYKTRVHTWEIDRYLYRY